jgi:ParB/RepB/Spo0J family partition protein
LHVAHERPPARKIVEIGLGDIREFTSRIRVFRPDVVEQLMESMRVRGLLQPIVVRPRKDAGYFLVAGAHRLEAARKLTWEGIQATVLEGLDADHAQLAEIDENLVRADLSPAENALHTAKRKEIYERIHPETKAGVAGGRPKKTSLKLREVSEGFVKSTSKASGKSRASVARDATRGKNVKVLTQVIGTSLDKGEELDALAKLPESKQQALAARAQAGEKVSAKTEVKKERRQEREAELGAKQTALPTKKRGVIYADPEYRFEPWSRETGMDRAADNHYSTSALEVIKSRNVASIAAGDCVLFLWATVPFEKAAHEVMEAWGFKYKSQVVWDKGDGDGDDVGTGYWFRNQHEVLLVGTRGKIPAPAPGTQWKSIVRAPCGKHSEKPKVFYELIEAYFPNLPKIELNCRGPARPGWAAWGNEATP